MDNIRPIFEIFKDSMLDLKTTEMLLRKIRIKQKVMETAWHGREMPYHNKVQQEELTRLHSEFASYAFARGWQKD